MNVYEQLYHLQRKVTHWM